MKIVLVLLSLLIATTAMAEKIIQPGKVFNGVYKLKATTYYDEVEGDLGCRPEGDTYDFNIKIYISKDGRKLTVEEEDYKEYELQAFLFSPADGEAYLAYKKDKGELRDRRFIRLFVKGNKVSGEGYFEGLWQGKTECLDHFKIKGTLKHVRPRFRSAE